MLLCFANIARHRCWRRMSPCRFERYKVTPGQRVYLRLRKEVESVERRLLCSPSAPLSQIQGPRIATGGCFNTHLNKSHYEDGQHSALWANRWGISLYVLLLRLEATRPGPAHDLPIIFLQWTSRFVPHHRLSYHPLHWIHKVRCSTFPGRPARSKAEVVRRPWSGIFNTKVEGSLRHRWRGDLKSSAESRRIQNWSKTTWQSSGLSVYKDPSFLPYFASLSY